MKKLKRITALILSILMLMSMSVAVSATAGGDTYTIVINSPGDGYTYTAYQIFSGDYDDDVTSSTYGKLKHILWSDSIDTMEASTETIYTKLAAITDANGKNPFTLEGAALTSAAAVAEALEDITDDDVLNDFAVVIESCIKSSVTGTSSSSGVKQSDDSYNYTISGLACGYYLIKTTGVPSEYGAYTKYILTMTTTTDTSSEYAILASKYAIPDIDKQVSDVDANIGDIITYYLTASLPSDYDSYSTYKLVFNDTLSDGLTYNAGSVEVYVYTNETDAKAHTNGTKVDGSGYLVDPDTTGTDSFKVTLTDTKSLTSDGTTKISTDSSSLIQVVFNATLNKDAIIAGSGNPNEVYLEYSNDMYSDSMGKTVTDKVVTWTYEVNVNKVDADDGTAITASSAEFVLYKLVDDGNGGETTKYVQVDSDGKVTGWTDNIDDSGVTLTTDNGVFKVTGLDVGTYYLLETKAPNGYNKMSDPVEFTISAEYSSVDAGSFTEDMTSLKKLLVDNEEVTDITVKVKNQSGAALPSTGGIGTTIFYIVGGVLVVGAIILLITKKRMGGDDK